jgi:glycosyltransferase involved in cell wall biosynthesis
MTRQIRVVQMVYTFDVEVGGGGLSRFALELGQRLDPAQIEVSFCSLGYYCSPAGKERMRILTENGMNSFEATQEWDESKPLQTLATAMKNMHKIFSHYPVDILHSHSEYTDVAAMLLKLAGRAPSILRTVHYGFRYEWNRKPLRRALLTNFSYPIVYDLEIGINQANTARLNGRWLTKLLRRPAINVYNAISTDRFQNVAVDVIAKKRSLGIPSDSPVVGSVGRLADQKGYCYLIDAVPLVLKEFPNAYFLLVGDGPLAEEHKMQAQALGVASQVIFSGPRTDVEELLHCMDIFVSSSLWEGLPTVILEAMISERPVIATDIPGTNELVQHKLNGWLVPQADPAALAEAICLYLRYPDTGASFVPAALKTVESFTIEGIARKYEDLYHQLFLKKNKDR